MRQSIGILSTILRATLMVVPFCMQAHASEDTLIFEQNQSDFLLPSYFDTPPQPAPVPQPKPATIKAPGTPQNVPADIDILNEIFGDQTIPSPNIATTPAKGTPKVFYPTPKSVQEAKQEPLLTPLPPLPPVADAPLPPSNKVSKTSQYAPKLLAKENGKSKQNVPLPKDMRLQFNPQSTQLTESALKWISVYALNAKKDPTKSISLRVSNRDWPIQQARLGLIIQILLEKGLPARQLQVFHSDRDPDTVIISIGTDPNLTPIITPGQTKTIIGEQKTLSW